MMPYDEAISYAMFAINTLLEPGASDPVDVDDLEARSDDVLASLEDMRTTLKEMKA